VRAELVAQAEISFGRRSVDWELKGVPIRLEVGPRDVESNVVTLVRRDVGAKDTISLPAAAVEAAALLERVQDEMLAAATRERDDRIRDVSSLEDATEASEDGWARMPWSALRTQDGEARLREQGITVRCLTGADGSIPTDEDEPDIVAYLGRAY
jgi:prolyl-tRNA synthetase